ncbi:toprim domain-containing protein [Tianweitania sp. BSSL-BM11]|uniref:Toprim domain-containing protein n=1 Tax=Tianweitania aestuarii TaxID=2814886 RepID=A0ABS5RSM7_9HYPH|nr:toprim domain-containing protein [Tianweitania aestuarii]MBS9720054.1 toprim domain-containing protein [Tianweitania aestuarii]
MNSKGDLDLIKGQLQDRIRDLCQRLLPDGREESGQWVAFNPIEGDYKAGRLPAFKVRLRGGVIGAWKDWRSDAAGDVIKLVAYLQGTDTSGALAWSRDFLGLKSMSREEREGMRRVSQERKVRAEKDDARRRAAKLAGAEKLFNLATTSAYAEGRPAELHALAYFTGRDVPLRAIPDLARSSFRFSSATEWWKGATWSSENGRRFKTAAGPIFPAVHSAMRQWNGVISACHVTFLDPVKPVKAPVSPPKLMFGEALGAVIEISAGPSGEPFWMTEKPAPLVVAEGIETALSFALAAPEARVWACGSLAGVGNAPIGLPCVSWVLFARDNNHGNSQAQKQFETALSKLEESGKTIRVEASHVGDDFNDLAQGEE